MSASLLNEEQQYRYHERLGIMCGDKEPTPEQEDTALMEVLELPEEGTKLW